MKIKENIKQILFIGVLIVSLSPLIYIFVVVDGFAANSYCPYNTQSDQANFIICIIPKINNFEDVLQYLIVIQLVCFGANFYLAEHTLLRFIVFVSFLLDYIQDNFLVQLSNYCTTSVTTCVSKTQQYKDFKNYLTILSFVIKLIILISKIGLKMVPQSKKENAKVKQQKDQNNSRSVSCEDLNNDDKIPQDFQIKEKLLDDDQQEQQKLQQEEKEVQ